MMQMIHGDCLKELKELADNSIDSVVTDPPYGLSAAKNSGLKTTGGFMGEKWDYQVPSIEIWKEVLRVLKPGGHLLSFGGARTYHRLVLNIEDAGFEIRDQICWVFGSGFPKSLNISKSIDKALGATRAKMQFKARGEGSESFAGQNNVRPWVERSKKQGFYEVDNDDPITEEAREWLEWGSALKPAFEPICLARKPLSENSIAKNVMRWGTGGLNIGSSRVPMENSTNSKVGRFPANFIHDGSDEVIKNFPQTRSGTNNYRKEASKELNGNTSATFGNESRSYGEEMISYGDKGSASRFFYCAKATKKERGEANKHPTVKPIKLMEYLVTLITPPEGIVLDPFMGSGTTGVAAKKNNFKFIGIEIEKEYYEIALKRIDKIYQKNLF